MKDTGENVRLHAKITNQAGAILEEREITGPRCVFDLSGQADGMYLLETDGAEGNQSWKIIKRQP